VVRVSRWGLKWGFEGERVFLGREKRFLRARGLSYSEWGKAGGKLKFS
jgi:hypothetical protein